MSIKSDIIMVFREGDSHCVHEVAARIGKDVPLVQIYLSTLTRDGLLVKCGDTERCFIRWMKRNPDPRKLFDTI